MGLAVGCVLHMILLARSSVMYRCTVVNTFAGLLARIGVLVLVGAPHIFMSQRF